MVSPAARIATPLIPSLYRAAGPVASALIAASGTGHPPTPSPYTGRALRNAFVDAWDGREEELRASAEARERFALGHQAGDPDTGLVWAGEGTDLITAVEPAGELVGQIITQAEGLLRGASRQLDH